jgi:hypothetical protein
MTKKYSSKEKEFEGEYGGKFEIFQKNQAG